MNGTNKLFPGFEEKLVKVESGDIRIRIGGEGSSGGEGKSKALLLLHGNPQTHMMWHAVAPDLARDYTVVCADLRGYGQSFKPPVSDDHSLYSKQAMALDMVQLMASLGYDDFYLAGHDRGARVAHRLALDHPARVLKMALLDIVPTIEHFERTDMAFAMGYAHWFWLAQPHPKPENLINATPQEWFFGHTSREPKGDDFFHPEALQDYLAAVQSPDVITAICEDYRAAATVDMEHDRASREAGIKIKCPTLLLWGARGKIEQWYEPIDIWSDYCEIPPSGGSVDSGHYLAEEAPHTVIDDVRSFFRDK